MFVGTVPHQIDDKGRMRIPSKFKHELGENPFIMQGAEKCLYVYPREFADEMLKSVFGGGKFNDKAMNAEKARLMSKACYGEEDKQGRITIPAALLKYAGIVKSSDGEEDGAIVSIGAYDHVQIWSKEAWEKATEGDNAGEAFDELKEQG